MRLYMTPSPTRIGMEDPVCHIDKARNTRASCLRSEPPPPHRNDSARKAARPGRLRPKPAAECSISCTRGGRCPRPRGQVTPPRYCLARWSPRFRSQHASGTPACGLAAGAPRHQPTRTGAARAPRLQHRAAPRRLARRSLRVAPRPPGSSPRPAERPAQAARRLTPAAAAIAASALSASRWRRGSTRPRRRRP